jgi:hypothetical protein
MVPGAARWFEGQCDLLGQAGGVEYAPHDKIRNVEPLVMLPRRVKDFCAAKRWNDKVRGKEANVFTKIQSRRAAAREERPAVTALSS